MMMIYLDTSRRREEEGVTWGDDDDLFRHMER